MSDWLAPVLLAACGAAYVVASQRPELRRSRRPWPVARTLAFLGGLAVVQVALGPDLDARADADLGVHALQHLLLAMVGPLLLVLGAPGTLLLRALPRRGARRFAHLLRSRPVGLLTHPVVALVLSTGGTVLLYTTPLHDLTTRHELVHRLVHVHLVAAGSLFAWAVAGPDPAPHRPSVRVRLVVLGVAVAVHATLAQVLYAGLLPVHAPADQLRAAGDLMYYGGDLAEVALALAVLGSWRPERSRRRRTDVPAEVVP